MESIYTFTSSFEADRLLKEGKFLVCQTVFDTRSLVKSFNKDRFVMAEGVVDKSKAEKFWAFDTLNEAMGFLDAK